MGNVIKKIYLHHGKIVVQLLGALQFLYMAEQLIHYRGIRRGAAKELLEFVKLPHFPAGKLDFIDPVTVQEQLGGCLLYTSDAADE